MNANVSDNRGFWACFIISSFHHFVAAEITECVCPESPLTKNEGGILK